MKNTHSLSFWLSASVLFCASFARISLAQSNSVQLKDGGGALLSQHSSITEAYNAIPSTITQAYLVEILSSYNGSAETLPVRLSARSGSNSSTIITIRPAAGNTGEMLSVNSANNTVISFDDADYVILDGRPGGLGSVADLTIQNTATTGTNSHTIQFINGATHNIVRYCRSLNATASGAGPRNIFFATSPSNPSGNSDNTVEYCIVDGGRSGVGSNGTAGSSNMNNLVRGCEIREFGFAGVWMLAGTGNMTIDSCTIFQTTGVSVTNPSGIDFSQTEVYTATVRKTRVYDIKSTSTSSSLAIRGIYTQVAPAAGSVINLENNFVSLTANNNNAVSTYGIHFTGTNAYTANVYYNTVLIGGVQITGTSGNIVSCGINKGSTSAAGEFNLKNNISINTRTGGPVGVVHCGFGAASGANVGVLNLDNNCYFGTAAGSFHTSWGGINYTNLADYKAALSPNEAHSIFKNVTFASSIDLHLAGSSIGDVDLAGTPLAGITTDIDNDPRGTVTPYKGADESTPLVSVTEPSPGHRTSFQLYQNFPNPFNPESKIVYEVPRGEFVELQIHDLLGREVATLVNEYKERGTYQVNFDGTRLGSGVYFYTLWAGGSSVTRKMVLTK